MNSSIGRPCETPLALEGVAGRGGAACAREAETRGRPISRASTESTPLPFFHGDVAVLILRISMRARHCFVPVCLSGAPGEEPKKSESEECTTIAQVAPPLSCGDRLSQAVVFVLPQV